MESQVQRKACQNETEAFFDHLGTQKLLQLDPGGASAKGVALPTGCYGARRAALQEDLKLVELHRASQDGFGSSPPRLASLSGSRSNTSGSASARRIVAEMHMDTS